MVGDLHVLNGGRVSRSAWRPNDVVAFEQARTLSLRRVAQIAKSSDGASPRSSQVEQLRSLLVDAARVDGFDRTASQRWAHDMAISLEADADV